MDRQIREAIKPFSTKQLVKFTENKIYNNEIAFIIDELVDSSVLETIDLPEFVYISDSAFFNMLSNYVRPSWVNRYKLITTLPIDKKILFLFYAKS